MPGDHRLRVCWLGGTSEALCWENGLGSLPPGERGGTGGRENYYGCLPYLALPIGLEVLVCCGWWLVLFLFLGARPSRERQAREKKSHPKI